MTKIKFFVIQVLLLIAAVQCQNPFFDGSSNSCSTPTGMLGSCVSINSCQPLVNIITNSELTPEIRQFMRQSREACNQQPNARPIVCCPLPSNNVNMGTTSRADLLPTDCGQGDAVRIVGGEKTEIDEFPWTALLEYTTPVGKKFICGGALISERYVLTAAHCLVGKDLPRQWRLTGVRLGEYDLSSARDCVPDGPSTFLCSDDPINVGVEEQIVHESYLPRSSNQKHDLAILRLSRPVSFSTYVKPICLPNSRNMNDRLWVSGWGKTENRSQSDVKLKVDVPVVDLNTCDQRYSNSRFTPTESHICAGGEKGKDSCNGDSGGPLMDVETTPSGRGRWSLVGVVSLGPQHCGRKDIPGAYTRISDYISWIHSKLRP